MKKGLKWIFLGFIGIILLLGAGFFVWTQFTYELINAEGVELNEPLPINDDWIIYSASNADTGFVLYPGAKVEPEAYAYLAQELSQQGITVAIPSVTLNLSIFDSAKAEELIQREPDLHWYIGGHSMGGAAAAMYADNHLETIEGLLLFGSYAASNESLHSSSLPVLSLSASEDGLSTPEKIEDNSKNLPDTTDFIEIEGGNHAYFGLYGEQTGDGDAHLSVAEQQEAIIEIVISWITEQTNEKRNRP
ncbi:MULTISPECIES: alpha/beta family hydrolase [Shouchella]|uniref:Alpha/beta hydrolase n=2 Tax=Shouchella TaxID=2893057 RepID=A0ABY7WA76_9BACI|nr:MULTISPECIES: alpha/beta family hydrolase [Shouchella]MED4128806.1 alpha/beta hydrolase [Shouchella miscanthi]WDF05827.1 alpha/beta hydrolase [Shouchella hunanensis]